MASITCGFNLLVPTPTVCICTPDLLSKLQTHNLTAHSIPHWDVLKRSRMEKSGLPGTDFSLSPLAVIN